MKSIKTIGVIGMGYVGIPSAVLFANSDKFDFVYGFQRNSNTSGYKINLLNNGASPIKGKEPHLDYMLKKVVDNNKFKCTDDFTQIKHCHAITLAIQTPFKTPTEPDYSAIYEALLKVGKYMSKDTLVVIESTITPRFTETTAKTILEKQSGFECGTDFMLAHAPERVMVGRLIRNIQEHDRIIGGIDNRSTEHAIELYKPIITTGKIIPMSCTAAEATKTAENAFRDTQIAMINQLALYCESLGINVYDVRNGIDSLKGEGITRAILYPGAGVGGHCLTKDTYHLELGKNKSTELYTGPNSIFKLSRTINDHMPHHMFYLTIDAFDRLYIPPCDSVNKIAILGWSFIPNSDDDRNTPSLNYKNHIEQYNYKCKVHDPYSRSASFDDVVKDADAIVIMTAHDMYKKLNALDIKRLMKKKHPIIIDGRNVVNPDEFIAQGFVYKGIGRGDKNNHVIVG